jgi:predicted DNA-binding WGR domain protein
LKGWREAGSAQSTSMRRHSRSVRDELRGESCVSALTLYRIDPTRRMRRFYIMDVQPDLFGQWSFIREWGRIGSPGQVRIVTCPNEDEAWSRLARHRDVKERRGYCPAPGIGTATLPR